MSEPLGVKLRWGAELRRLSLRELSLDALYELVATCFQQLDRRFRLLGQRRCHPPGELLVPLDSQVDLASLMELHREDELDAGRTLPLLLQVEEPAHQPLRAEQPPCNLESPAAQSSPLTAAAEVAEPRQVLDPGTAERLLELLSLQVQQHQELLQRLDRLQDARTQDRLELQEFRACMQEAQAHQNAQLNRILELCDHPDAAGCCPGSSQLALSVKETALHALSSSGHPQPGQRCIAQPAKKEECVQAQTTSAAAASMPELSCTAQLVQNSSCGDSAHPGALLTSSSDLMNRAFASAEADHGKDNAWHLEAPPIPVHHQCGDLLDDCPERVLALFPLLRPHRPDDTASSASSASLSDSLSLSYCFLPAVHPQAEEATAAPDDGHTEVEEEVQAELEVDDPNLFPPEFTSLQRSATSPPRQQQQQRRTALPLVLKS